MALPSDSNSLLVPVFLNAWAVSQDPENQLARYELDYKALQNFADPFPEPTIPGNSTIKKNGIYLKWALPDALTHSPKNDEGNINLPLVPNRWVVIRFIAPGKTPPANDKWQMTAWVIQSDATEALTDDADSYPFLNPEKPSSIALSNDAVNVNGSSIGANHTIEKWEAQGDPGTPVSFLRAAGPGNISFAAYQPFCENVFAFTDSDDLPAPGTGVHHFSYMVIGWYGNAEDDPLHDITNAGDFNELLTDFKWSLPNGQPFPDSGDETPPVSSLYHGFTADVQWPYTDQEPPNVKSAVGKTALDALSALIQSDAIQHSKENPSDENAWLQAGNTLSELVEAAMLQLLDDYGVPGGQVLINQAFEKTWFGSKPGGTIWKVSQKTAKDSDFNVEADDLTTDQNKALIKQLGELNAAQQDFDLQQRGLESQQSELYMKWLTLVKSNTVYSEFGEGPTTSPDWESVLKPVFTKDLYPEVTNEVWNLICQQETKKASLPPSTSVTDATTWADTNWTFPNADGTKQVSLSDLGLTLKGVAAPTFQHPVDPVLLISSSGRTRIHGEDHIYNSSGTLTVRLGGQTITGIAVVGQPKITDTEVAATGVVFDAFSSMTNIPSISHLLTEAFFYEPLNASLMAAAASGANANDIKNGILSLLAQHDPNNEPSESVWQGTPPSPAAYSLWDQAWSPLWVEWRTHYYPMVDADNHFTMNNWQFDGDEYHWTGKGFNSGSVLEFQGRTIVSPFAQSVFKTALKKYLDNHSIQDSPELETLLNDVLSWDILSQSLSGFSDQLLTKLSYTTFPPPTSGKMNDTSSIPCPPNGGKTPIIGDLVQGENRSIPELESTHNFDAFYAFRQGLANFNAIQVVDEFGQTIQVLAVTGNSPQGNPPLTSRTITPPASLLPSDLDHLNPFILRPNLVQGSRLNLDFLSNDGSGQLITSTNNDNPVCGWLLANHLDRSIDVYDGDGNLLGELMPPPFGWRPRPGKAGSTPQPAEPSDIKNEALKNVVSTIANQTEDVFNDFMQVIDETLWMSDPLGGHNDAFLSALIGRPLAIVQMQVSLELDGVTAKSQLLDDMLTANSTTTDFTPVNYTADVEKVEIPVRLGSLQLRSDGVMGYFRNGTESADNIYPTFYSVHSDPTLSAGDQFIKTIVDQKTTPPTYQGDLSVNTNGYEWPVTPPTPITVTMILDPLGKVHGDTGMIPTAVTELPDYTIKNLLNKLYVNFQTGPVLTDENTLRLPKPAEKQGKWTWLQKVPSDWIDSSIVNADDSARFPLNPPTIKEGWLQLKGIKKDD